MEENRNETVENVTEVKEVETKPKRTNKKPSRTIEELDKIGVRSMSEAEKAKYIEYLREELAMANGTIESYKSNCEKAYASNRMAIDNLNNFKAEATAKINFMQQAIGTCYSSIIMANK